MTALAAALIGGIVLGILADQAVERPGERECRDRHPSARGPR